MQKQNDTPDSCVAIHAPIGSVVEVPLPTESQIGQTPSYQMVVSTHTTQTTPHTTSKSDLWYLSFF